MTKSTIIGIAVLLSSSTLAQTSLAQSRNDLESASARLANANTEGFSRVTLSKCLFEDQPVTVEVDPVLGISEFISWQKDGMRFLIATQDSTTMNRGHIVIMDRHCRLLGDNATLKNRFMAALEAKAQQDEKVRALLSDVISTR